MATTKTTKKAPSKRKSTKSVKPSAEQVLESLDTPSTPTPTTQPTVPEGGSLPPIAALPAPDNPSLPTATPDFKATAAYQRRLNNLLASIKKLRQLEADFRIYEFKPNPGGQEEFFKNAHCHRRYVFAGNRFGKSEAGVAEDVAWCLGERPWYPEGHELRRKGIPKHGVKGLVIAQTWEKVNEIFTCEGAMGAPKGKFMTYCPPQNIIEKHKDTLGRINKIVIRNVIDGVRRDSIITFATVKSFVLNELNLESSDYDFIHGDEPIPRAMWIAVSRGLVDRNGYAWFLLTPLEEMWLYMQAVESAAKNPDDNWLFVGSALENPHLRGTDLFYENLSEEELACRRDGKPMAAGRLVIHAYNERRHLLKGTPAGWKSIDEPPKEALIGVAIDTHPQTAHAVLCVAMTKTDAIFFNERFERGSIEAMASWLKSKPYYHQIGYFLIEPAAFIPDQTTGRSYADVFQALGIDVQRASKAREQCIKLTNEHFLNDKRRVWVHESLAVTRRELMCWYFTKDNRPADKDDHMMECMGRLCMHDNLNYFEPPAIAYASAERVAVPNPEFAVSATDYNVN